MRNTLLFGLVGFHLLATAAAAKEPPANPFADPPTTCGKFGTTVEFVATPKEAAAQAKKDEKLVFVLHVSGNFETPEFT